MTTITHSSSSSSEAESSNYHLLFDSKIHTSPLTQPGRVPAARILKCGICFEDFEWLSLKNLPGYQGDSQDYQDFVAPALTDPLPLLPRIAERKSNIPILCGHARGQDTRTRQRYIRWTSALFGGRRVLSEEQGPIAAAPAASTSADVDTLFETKEALKLGCSLHMDMDHAFCMECSVRYIDTQVKESIWPIVCPREKCAAPVDSFAVEMLLGEDAVKWHILGLEHAITKKVNVFSCLF